MKPLTRQGCILASALLLAVPSLAQQASSPRLAAYYAEVQWTMVDPSYAPDSITFTASEDLNGDGHQDLVVLGSNDTNRGGYNVFNHDGAPDFYVQFAPGSQWLRQDQPLIWLNDGAGHFSTLKVGDFVPPGKEWLIGSDLLVATRNGYTFITTQRFPGRGLEFAGLLASTPYRTTLPILPGGVIRSDNGQFRLTYQADGNLVLNDARDGTSLWSTATGGSQPGRAFMQADGNFVVYDAAGVARWSSETGDNPGAYLWVRDDGGLAVFRADGQTLWSRNP